MKGDFVFIVNDEIKHFSDYRDIPEEFDHVIKFVPELPEGPHTDHQHNEIGEWNQRLKKLMEKEHARRNKNR